MAWKKDQHFSLICGAVFGGKRGKFSQFVTIDPFSYKAMPIAWAFWALAIYDTSDLDEP